MIPGGRFLGMALVSTQKALSLVQEQVAGQRAVFGALTPPTRLRHSADRQRRPRHLRTSAAIVVVPLQDDELLCKGYTDRTGIIYSSWEKGEGWGGLGGGARAEARTWGWGVQMTSHSH